MVVYGPLPGQSVNAFTKWKLHPGIMPVSGSKYVMIWTKTYFGFHINCTECIYKKTEQVIHFVIVPQEYAWL